MTLSGPDPKRPATQAPNCDTGKGLVVLDGLWATAAGITTLAVGADNGAAAIAPAVIGAAFVAAAIHGNNAVNECRAANEEYVAAVKSSQVPPAVASDGGEDEQRPSRPAAAPAPAAPEVQPIPQPPPAAPAAAPSPAPVAAAQPAPEKPAPTIEMWTDFWKEVR